LDQFGRQIAKIVETTSEEAEILRRCSEPLARLLETDDWLPDSAAATSVDGYQQHLLCLDPDKRFSVVSFVWGPGQGTPIHNHLTWGLVGVLRGRELSQRYRTVEGEAPVPVGAIQTAGPGEISSVTSEFADAHRVWNGLAHETTISIHLYGGDIGAIDRHIIDDVGRVRSFRSQYSSQADAA
jgi:predicted metal-dependent enzyme (double-stranded beta helix superfamily)